jgi:hypothetical protein
MLFGAVPNALARNTWYIDGVNRSDNNDCQSRQHACKNHLECYFAHLAG